LHSLNPEQRSAVEYGIDGDSKPPPALLIAAGAGTGKTKALAHRVAHLILNGRDPQRLLLLTFTRRAALEMTRRSQLILADARGNAARDSSTLAQKGKRLAREGYLHQSPSEELARAYEPYIDTCIAAFGPDRGMFESNLPPDGVSSSYAVLWNAFKRLAANFSAEEKAKLLNGTAKRAYRLA
jgi:superfamily I DNA/RNA helicase